MSEVMDEWVEKKIAEGYTPLQCEKCGKLLALIPPTEIDAPLLYECDHYVWIPYGNVSFDPRRCEYVIIRGTMVWCLIARERKGENAEFERKYGIRRWYYPYEEVGDDE